MARIYLIIVLVVGGVLVVGTSADLVAAGRYALLWGPGELAKSVFFLGDMVDDAMAMQSALARQYGVTNLAQAIQVLEARYEAAYPVIMPARSLNSNIPIGNHHPLHGVNHERSCRGGF